MRGDIDEDIANDLSVHSAIAFWMLPCPSAAMSKQLPVAEGCTRRSKLKNISSVRSWRLRGFRKQSFLLDRIAQVVSRPGPLT